VNELLDCFSLDDTDTGGGDTAGKNSGGGDSSGKDTGGGSAGGPDTGGGTMGSQDTGGGASNTDRGADRRCRLLRDLEGGQLSLNPRSRYIYLSISNKYI